MLGHRLSAIQLYNIPKIAELKDSHYLRK